MSTMGLHKLHVLIVDDFENFRSTLYKMLMDIGIGNVDSAHNGEEALRYCRSRSYDVILCDYNLGKGKTGQQVLEDLRIGKTLCTDSLFILVSAETSRSIVMAAYDFEPDAYLTKPITTKVLEQRMTRLLVQRQALAAIYKAQRAQRWQEAEQLCLAQIKSSSRYSATCQKMLGNLYLETQQFDKAHRLFDDVLEVRELEWALLGKARLCLLQDDVKRAQLYLQKVLAINHLCMKAYDLLAEVHRVSGDKQQLQETLQKAVELSPLAILRQQALGQIAQDNRDFKTACDAYKQAVKIGENSSYNRAFIHTMFAQTVVDLYSFDKEAAKPYAREALKAVLDIEQKFHNAETDSLQAPFMASQLYVCLGDDARAKSEFDRGNKRLLNTSGEHMAAEIEMIRALRRLGQGDDANKRLAQLSSKYAGDQRALEWLDSLQDEPQSEKHKQLVAQINKTGIAAYNEKNYVGAAAAFQSALRTLPNHIGLRLNCAQALLDGLKQHFDPAEGEQLWQTLSKVEDIISFRHAQFPRYRQLREGYENLLRERESGL